METRDEEMPKREHPPLAKRAKAASRSVLLVPVACVLLATVLALALLWGDVRSLVDNHLAEVAPFLLIAILAGTLGVSALLYLSIRGNRIPAALTFFFASLPWLTGLAGLRWKVATTLALELDPITTRTAALDALGDGLSAHACGAYFAGALYFATAVGSASAARTLWPAKQSTRSRELLCVAALALPVTAIALATAIRSHLEAEAYIGFLHVDVESQLVFLERGTDSLVRAESASRVVLGLSIAGAITLLLFSLRHRPAAKTSLFGAAALAVALFPVALDRYGRRATEESVERIVESPWVRVEGFAPVPMSAPFDEQTFERPWLIADAQGLHLPSGERLSREQAIAPVRAAARIADAEASEQERRRAEREAERARNPPGPSDLVEDWAPRASLSVEIPGCEVYDDFDELVVAVDRRTPLTAFRDLVALASQAERHVLVLVGNDPVVVPPATRRSLPIGSASVAYRPRVLRWKLPIGACAPADDRTHLILMGRVGTTPLSAVTTYAGGREVSLDDRETFASLYRVLPSARVVALLALDQGATAESLVETARRIAAVIDVRHWVLSSGPLPAPMELDPQIGFEQPGLVGGDGRQWPRPR